MVTAGQHCRCSPISIAPFLPQEAIQYELDRRRPGQSRITTPRKESDTAEILSGLAADRQTTLGTPICVLVRNADQRSGDYAEMEAAYRPSHADATYDFKYGIRAVAGGGRSSARETIGRVAAGAIAKKLLHEVAGTEVGPGGGVTGSVVFRRGVGKKVGRWEGPWRRRERGFGM